MKVKLIPFILLLLLTAKNFAQTLPTSVPFELSSQFNGQFDYVIIGNTLSEFDNRSIPVPPCETLTESSATLNLEPNQNVVKAYLFWSGVGDGLFNPEIQLNGIPLFADQIKAVNPQASGGFSNFFGSSKDITDIVIEEGNDLYTFSQLDLNPLLPPFCTSGTHYAGWSILVIYEDDTLPIQQVNVYNGFESVIGTGDLSTSQINIGSLNIVDTANARLGFLAWNGSSNVFLNESITFNGNLLSNDLNPTDNPFNGTNSYTGATDLWNMDLDVFDISDYIEVGDTQATITFGSLFARFIQNVVTVIRSELPDASVELVDFSGVGECDERDFTIETVVGNFDASDVLPANTPISFFVLDEDGEEVFLDTFFTQTQLAIDASETQFLDITIPADIPDNTTLIVKVNTLADGSNPINESNILNNTFEQDLSLFTSSEPLQVQDLAQCANLSESFFDLEEAIDEAEEIEDEISFHLSFEDAENDENEITEIDNYNPTSLTETIYVRRFDGNCFSVNSFEMESLIPPQINEPEVFLECDFTEEQLGFTEFDLSTKIDEITGGNLDYEVEFFTTLAEAEDLENENGLASPYTNENAFSQTLFVRVTDITNDCVSFTELELEINLLPVIAQSQDIPPLEACDDDENGLQTLDLTSPQPFILNGLSESDHQIQYFETQTDAQNNENEIPNPEEFTSGEQEIFVRVTELETDCFSFTSFDIIINELPPLQEGETNLVCDLNDDGTASFFLPFAENSIIDDTEGFSFTYFEALADAENNQNPIEDPANYVNIETPTQTLFALATDDETGCQNIQPIEIEVVPVDFIPFELTDLEVCAPSEDGLEVAIDLTEQEEFIFGNTDPNIYTTTYHFTQAEAASGQNPIANPSAFETLENPQEIWVRIVNNVINCVEIGAFEYEVLLAPVLTPAEEIPTFEQCPNAENSPIQEWDLNTTIPFFYNEEEVPANISFHLSQEEAENNQNPQPSAFENTTNPQTLFIRAEAIESGCVEFTAIELLVNTLDEAFFPELLEVCDNNNDGFSESFDLGSIISDYQNNFPNYELSFHPTFPDAENQTNILPEVYANVQAFEQTIFAYVQNEETSCEQIFELDLFTRNTPQTESPEALILCDINESGVKQFDLTEVKNEVLENVSNVEDLNIEYYNNFQGAEEENPSNLINNPEEYESQSDNQIVYIRITDPTSDLNCFAIEAIELIVEPLPDIIAPERLSVCDDETGGSTTNEQATFDLFSKVEEITQGDQTILVNFYEDEALENQITDTENFVNTQSNPQVVYVEAIDLDTECTKVTTLTIEAIPEPTIPELNPLVECDPDNNGFAEFDLGTEIENIISNEVDVEISFHETQQEAFFGTEALATEDEDGNPILYENFNPFSQTIFVRAINTETSNQTETDCFVVRELELIVEPSPQIQDFDDLRACSDNPNIAVFDLTQNSSLIIGNQENVTLTYHQSLANAENGTNAIAFPVNYNGIDGEFIYIRLEGENGCIDAFNASEDNRFQLFIDDRPEINLTASNEIICASPSDAQQADNEIGEFDLTQKDEEINPNTGDPNTEVIYYASEEDFEAGIPITDPSNFFTSQSPQVIFAEVVDPESGCPSSTQVTFEIRVNPLPLVDISNMDGSVICIDRETGEIVSAPTLDTGLNDNDYEFEWFLDGEELAFTGSALTVEEPGLYEVIVVDLATSNITECERSSFAEVIESSGVEFEVNILSAAFDGSHSIEIVNIEGNGEFEFSVDGGPWVAQDGQSSLTFTGLEAGEVEVIGRDLGGCDTEIKIISLIDYPKFFTPNNDGFNDSWNIIGLANQSNAKIYIFDRYGKLLKQLSPSSEGWDGTYNGKPMPSNDYWFKVEYTDPRTGARKTFKSNFTLKR